MRKISERMQAEFIEHEGDDWGIFPSFKLGSSVFRTFASESYPVLASLGPGLSGSVEKTRRIGSVRNPMSFQGMVGARVNRKERGMWARMEQAEENRSRLTQKQDKEEDYLIRQEMIPMLKGQARSTGKRWWED